MSYAQLSEEEFFTRLERVYVGALLYGEKAEFSRMRDLIKICWDIEEGSKAAARKRELYEIMSDAPLKIPGFALFFDIGSAKGPVNDHDLMDSWIYDRATGTVILNVDRGAHESLLAKLYACQTGAELGMTITETDEMAERYVIEGRGFFLSSQARRPLKSKNVRLTAQEKAVFGTDFREIES